MSALAQRYSFKRYEQALPNQDVRAFVQDRIGYLWVGTDNGLYRYDGHRFRGFGTAEGLPSSTIQALAIDSDGTLWAATYSGLARLRGERFEQVDISPGRAAFAIASDSVGRLYVGTSKGLLVSEGRAEKPTFTVYSSPGQTIQIVRSIAVGKTGDVWYTCGTGLCHLDAGKVVSRPEWGVPEDVWQAVVFDANGNLWARSRTSLIELSKGETRFERRDGNLPPALTDGRLMAGADGELWVPTVRGLARRSGTGWDIIGKSRGLPISSVQCAYQDREGSIWIGLNGAGIVRWLGFPAWESWTEAEGLSSEAVWGIRRDGDGTLWSVHDMGVSRFREASRRWEDLEVAGLPAGTTTRLAQAPDGSLWAAQPTGIVHIEPRRSAAQVYGRESGIADPWITALAVDAHNRVWAGTRSGLYLGAVREGRFRFERQELPLEYAQDFIYECLIDSHGRLWIGTAGGLLRQDAGKWIRLTTSSGLLNNRIAHLAEDTAGSLWVGYAEPLGVSRLVPNGERPAWRHFSTRTGLRSDQIFFIGSDKRGWTWFGTDQGLDIFDGKSWRHLDRTDGMISDDCNGDAFWADADGSVWIGTSRGISHLRIPAGGLAERPTDSHILLTSAAFGERNVGLDRPISVPWGQRSLDVVFAALTFVNEDSVRFRYRIAGLDQHWTETQSRDVHVPSLPSGSYTFEVQANVERGAWNGTPARLGFSVRPAWWRTWWFDLAALGVAAFAAFQLWAWRLRSILRRQKELEDAVADRTQSLTLEKARAERERDIVETQKVEIEHLYKEARQASRLKDEFLANMSHELRTPMNGIIGMAELALGTSLTAEQGEYLQTVRSSSWSLLAVLDDILDFSTIEAGNFRMSAVVFELRGVVSEAARSLESQARQKGLELTTHVSTEVPQRVVGDPLRLRQVLLKLLSNAIKFTERGRISVCVGTKGQTENGRLHFEVADTGIGIPLDKQSMIFEAFSQVDGSHKRKHGGAGLGLTICSRFVQLMRGQIWVESELGKGSRFHFTAEFDRAPAAVPIGTSSHEQVNPQTGSLSVKSTSDPKTPVVKPLRILLAEDNPVNQKLAVRLLQSRGHCVVAAGNGIEALAAFALQPFDAVLMDVQMPEMGGYEATAKIREKEQMTGTHIPIIALTAHAMPGDREKCLNAGMDDYVAKPIRPGELFMALERANNAA